MVGACRGEDWILLHLRLHKERTVLIFYPRRKLLLSQGRLAFNVGVLIRLPPLPRIHLGHRRDHHFESLMVYWLDIIVWRFLLEGWTAIFALAPVWRGLLILTHYNN